MVGHQSTLPSFFFVFFFYRVSISRTAVVWGHSSGPSLQRLPSFSLPSLKYRSDRTPGDAAESGSLLFRKKKEIRKIENRDK